MSPDRQSLTSVLQSCLVSSRTLCCTTCSGRFGYLVTRKSATNEGCSSDGLSRSACLPTKSCRIAPQSRATTGTERIIDFTNRIIDLTEGLLSRDPLLLRIPHGRSVIEVRVICQMAADGCVIAEFLVLNNLIPRADRTKEVRLVI